MFVQYLCQAHKQKIHHKYWHDGSGLFYLLLHTGALWGMAWHIRFVSTYGDSSEALVLSFFWPFCLAVLAQTNLATRLRQYIVGKSASRIFRSRTSDKFVSLLHLDRQLSQIILRNVPMIGISRDRLCPFSCKIYRISGPELDWLDTAVQFKKR